MKKSPNDKLISLITVIAFITVSLFLFTSFRKINNPKNCEWANFLGIAYWQEKYNIQIQNELDHPTGITLPLKRLDRDGDKKICE